MGLNNLLKWWETIVISFAKFSTYRLNFILTILGPAFVALFIKCYLWTAIYQGHSSSEINGRDLSEMIDYQIWALVISLVAQGHTATDLATEIRHGKISSYLIYPFNFWEFHTASFLAFETVQCAIAMATIALLGAIGTIPIPPIETLALGLSYCLLVSLLWFSLQFFTGIIAFWIEETWTLRVLFQIVVTFLSGAIIPLDLFPPWAQQLLDATPFPFMAYYPIKIFMGESIPWERGLLTLLFWTVLMVAVNIVVWRKGVRMYTAAGM